MDLFSTSYAHFQNIGLLTYQTKTRLHIFPGQYILVLESPSKKFKKMTYFVYILVFLTTR
jgi:UV DNA damage repair endonuclease